MTTRNTQLTRTHNTNGGFQVLIWLLVGIQLVIAGMPTTALGQLSGQAGGGAQAAGFGEEDAFESYSGRFSIRWTCNADAVQSSGIGDAACEYFLDDPVNGRLKLELDDALADVVGGFLNVDGKTLAIVGNKVDPNSPTSPLKARSIRVVPPPTPSCPEPIPSANRRQVAILCKFSDKADEPKTPAQIKAEMDGPFPSLDNYWREASQGLITVSNCTVAGNRWYTLDHPESYYHTGGSQFDRDTLLADAVAKAKDDVYFPGYYGISVLVNTDVGDTVRPAAQRNIKLSVDLPAGCDQGYGVSWLTAKDYGNVRLWAHEIGHTLGMPHSGGQRTSHPEFPYTSNFDIMSLGGIASLQTSSGYAGVHPIAYHKSVRVADGVWIPSQQVYVAPPLTTHSIPLDVQTLPSTGWMMAKIPFGSNPKHYYTVEVRKWHGMYEGNYLPRQGVIIHRVNQTSSLSNTDALLIDVDFADGTSNDIYDDEGAVWLTGETFTDTGAGVQVSVGSQTVSGFNVTITRGNVGPPPQPGDYSLDFNVSTPNYVRAGDSASLSAESGTLTVEAWIRPRVLGSKQVVVSKRGVMQTGSGGYELSIEPNGSVKFVTFDGAGSALASLVSDDSVNPSPVFVDRWSHISGSYHATSKTIRVSVNGRVTPYTYTTPKKPVDGVASLNIGRSAIGGKVFSGRIDNVRISNLALYTATFVPEVTPAVIQGTTQALWLMNENGGTMTFDAASGNTATLTPESSPPVWALGASMLP